MQHEHTPEEWPDVPGSNPYGRLCHRHGSYHRRLRETGEGRVCRLQPVRTDLAGNAAYLLLGKPMKKKAIPYLEFRLVLPRRL